jgi:lipid A ethanolaminephosphotransferase
MNVFHRAGIDAVWWDNDGGDKGVADGVTYQSYMLRNDPERCEAGTCQDDIFLDDLDTFLSGVKRDTVLVLHQRGSHGPAYYLRYPNDFRPFQPDCRQYDPTACTMQERLNAYDNTIAYNDRFLGRVIALLQKHADVAAGSMLYVSDHGESLGENGLYMHGTPYERAPAEQTRVPLIIWTDPAYQSLSGLDAACGSSLAGQPFSHDNIYHTLLGMMDVKTKVYDRSLDILATCRARPAETD